MKKTFCILLLTVFTFWLNANVDTNCFQNLRRKAITIQKYKFRWERQKVKKVIKEIISGLKHCGVSDDDLSQIRSFQKRVITQVDRIANEKKKQVIPTSYYSIQLKKMIRQFEKKYKKNNPDSSAAAPIPSIETIPKTVNNETGETIPQNPPPPSQNKTTDITARFPSDDFIQENHSMRGKKPFVVLADELQTKVDLMEKKIMYISGTVKFYRKGFSLMIILVIAMLVAIALLVLILRATNKKLSQTNTSVNLLRRKITGNTDNRQYR